MTEIARNFNDGADLMFEKVKKACLILGLRIAKEDATTRRLIVSTGWSAFSWGETMDIIVSQQKEHSTVKAESRPKIWFNLTASGRADRNVSALFEELQRNAN